jgi:hypothetical protein
LDFADLDGSLEPLQEDSIIIGLSCFTLFFKNFETSSIAKLLRSKKSNFADSNIIRASRIACLARNLADDKVAIVLILFHQLWLLFVCF